MTPINPQATYAALATIADSIRAGLAVPPGSIDMWSQDRTAAELLTVADEIGARVIIHHPTIDYRGHASVRYAYPVGKGAAPITLYTTSSDISTAAVTAYAAYNDKCVSEVPE